MIIPFLQLNSRKQILFWSLYIKFSSPYYSSAVWYVSCHLFLVINICVLVYQSLQWLLKKTVHGVLLISGSFCFTLFVQFCFHCAWVMPAYAVSSFKGHTVPFVCFGTQILSSRDSFHIYLFTFLLNRNCSLVRWPGQVLQESFALKFASCQNSLLLVQNWYLLE
jgi:hypothetical protein